MSRPKRHPLIAGARVTSLGTLSSRVLGMVRDMAMAALFGLVGGGVMDAFVIAYRIPNLFRRLFGEGALTASYLPVLSAQLETAQLEKAPFERAPFERAPFERAPFERDRTRAWQLASVTMTWLTVLLAALVLAGEAIYGLVWLVWGDVAGMGLLVGLGAVMLPYLLLICLAAQLTATLQALGHFTVGAFAPALANVCWLTAIWGVAPFFDQSQPAQAYVLAVAVLVAGVLQLGVQVPVLRRFGFRFDYDWSASREALSRIARAMGPMLVGVAVTQINTFCDSLIAWGLAAAPGGPQRIAWLGQSVRYPLERGAVAALFYGERLYQFPLGVLGLAVATAIFPLLSRHAARGDRQKLGADLTLALRLVLFLGVPAAAGLIMLAEPLTRLLFQRGNFTPDDTARTAATIACYATGVWAFCALPVIVRGFYALGDYVAPAKIAGGIVGLNLALNLTLIWTPLAEAGLALATSISAALQVVVLLLIFSRRKSPLAWSALAVTAGRTLLATLLMAAAGYGTLRLIPDGGGLIYQLARVLLPLGVSVAVYGGVYCLLRGREPAILFGADEEGKHL